MQKTKKNKIIQLSKEFVDGKWQHVAFYRTPTGSIFISSYGASSERERVIACQQCHKRYRNKNSLSSHKSQEHS